MNKSIVVVHSGGMDSSICLALAIREVGAEQVLSLSFDYTQRHNSELKASELICRHWGVDHVVIPLHCLNAITRDALVDHQMEIGYSAEGVPNTLVVGRNGLMARLAAIHAHHLGAKRIDLGIIGVEAANSGYRDCTRDYMDRLEGILRIDLDDSEFKIHTPVVEMTKNETLEKAYELGELQYLLENTVTCYEGVLGYGCGVCPACELRNEGIRNFLTQNPNFEFSFKDRFSIN